jgi:hypothetical protein
MFDQWMPEGAAAAGIIEKNCQDGFINSEFITKNLNNKPCFNFDPIKSLINLAILQPPTWQRLLQFLSEHPSSLTTSPLMQFIKSEPPQSVDSEENFDIKNGTFACTPSTSAETSLRKQNIVKSNDDELANDDGEEFDTLVNAYIEHIKHMNRAMISIDDFLREPEDGPKFRKMVPSDVDKLSTVELSGLLYWLEKQHPFKLLEHSDREALLKRYSVRKLSLDHFYQASKHKEMVAEGKFAMLNNTYVPPNETGFEGVTDDEKTRQAKFDIFRPTLDRLWATSVIPFSKMNVTDAEIVTLHILLLWSAQNNRYVSAPVKDIMRKRREWAVTRLFEHYQEIGVSDPVIRLGEILLLLPEIEVVCDLHCTDFQVAKLFQFCDSLSSYWYDKWCYTSTD